MNRRLFLNTLGVAGASTVVAGGGEAEASTVVAPPNAYGVLVDTTLCAGCRNCEVVCAETNGLQVPDIDDESALEAERATSETQWTVVNRYETEAGEVFRKTQCMHCIQPACAAACLTKAMLKTDEGPVIWREDKCMGCRYCMISCPFDAPKFEYHSAVPKIQKCVMCWDRIREGGQPACVENCPGEALTFGKRPELIREARRRIHTAPDEYHDHIYGEHEAAGSGFLYIGAVPPEQLGLRTNVRTDSYPELTKGFLYSVPLILTLWPALLLALSRATRKEEEIAVRQIEGGER
jgi:Fe-S-cluster-containing dehydrogenase component